MVDGGLTVVAGTVLAGTVLAGAVVARAVVAGGALVDDVAAGALLEPDAQPASHAATGTPLAPRAVHRSRPRRLTVPMGASVARHDGHRVPRGAVLSGSHETMRRFSFLRLTTVVHFTHLPEFAIPEGSSIE